MHFSAAVAIPAQGDVLALVEAAMEPYSEEGENDAAFWDWWQVGGRFTGLWSDYDPRTDPNNIETCRMCGGAGHRPDAARFGDEWMAAMNGCNGCRGVGTSLKWPTSWADHEGDVIPVSAYLDGDLASPYTLVIMEGPALHEEEWNGSDFVRNHGDDETWAKTVRETLEPYRNQRLVIVDYHS